MRDFLFEAESRVSLITRMPAADRIDSGARVLPCRLAEVRRSPLRPSAAPLSLLAARLRRSRVPRVLAPLVLAEQAGHARITAQMMTPSPCAARRAVDTSGVGTEVARASPSRAHHTSPSSRTSPGRTRAPRGTRGRRSGSSLSVRRARARGGRRPRGATSGRRRSDRSTASRRRRRPPRCAACSRGREAARDAGRPRPRGRAQGQAPRFEVRDVAADGGRLGPDEERRRGAAVLALRARELQGGPLGWGRGRWCGRVRSGGRSDAIRRRARTPRERARERGEGQSRLPPLGTLPGALAHRRSVCIRSERRTNPHAGCAQCSAATGTPCDVCRGRCGNRRSSSNDRLRSEGFARWITIC